MTDAELVRLVDGLEDRSDTPLTLDDVESAAGQRVDAAIATHLLLVDHRVRLDGSDVTVCRLNRRHPLVAQLTGW